MPTVQHTITLTAGQVRALFSAAVHLSTEWEQGDAEWFSGPQAAALDRAMQVLITTGAVSPTNPTPRRP